MEFVRLCGAAGMKAIVRPGPYVCAEWDLGGLPAWLLNEPGLQLRLADPRFLEPAKAWMKKIGGLMAPLSVPNGGPLLMMQIENEAGFPKSEKVYMEELQKALRAGGYSGTVFTCDPSAEKVLRAGSLPGVLQAANFGDGAELAFKRLEAVSSNQPNFTAEFRLGWFELWGMPRQVVDTNRKLADFEWMMRTGASFNLYMFHGGTTRGLWTGSKVASRIFPITDCHDWLAPWDESGRPPALGSSGSQRPIARIETRKDPGALK